MQGLDMGAASSGLNAGLQVAGGFAGYRSAMANAAYAQANARSSQVDGASAMAASNAQYRAVIGNQLVAQGGSGFAMGTGSALDALNQSRVNEAAAAMNINRSASMRAQIYNAQASMDRQSATQALLSGVLHGASSLLKDRADYANANAGMGFGGATSPAGALQPSATPSLDGAGMPDGQGMNLSDFGYG